MFKFVYNIIERKRKRREHIAMLKKECDQAAMRGDARSLIDSMLRLYDYTQPEIISGREIKKYGG